MHIALEEALKRTLAQGQRCMLAAETVPLVRSLHRVLREDVTFPTQLPPFSYAQMDGYALPGDAEAHARFEVEGESRAGTPARVSPSNVAVAISTGAMMPAGFQAVVPWEHVEREGKTITLQKPVRLGQFIRRAGDDAQAGERVADAGTRLRLTHIPALAVAERAFVRVSRPPKVGLFLTGDELREPGTDNRPGSIVDSNAPMLVAMFSAVGAEVSVRHVADQEGALEAALQGCTADVVVTVGGAADGAHDHVAKAFAEVGAKWLFRGVAIKPGKPVGLAHRVDTERETTLVALPGNPGSAFVTALLVVLPLLRALEGERAASPSFLHAESATSLESAGERVAIHYGALTHIEGRLVFQVARASASGSVAGLLTAQALAFVPTGGQVAAGSRVRVLALGYDSNPMEILSR